MAFFPVPIRLPFYLPRWGAQRSYSVGPYPPVAVKGTGKGGNASLDLDIMYGENTTMNLLPATASGSALKLN